MLCMRYPQDCDSCDEYKCCSNTQTLPDVEATDWTKIIRNRLDHIGPYFLGSSPTSNEAIKRDLSQACAIVKLLKKRLERRLKDEDQIE